MDSTRKGLCPLLPFSPFPADWHADVTLGAGSVILGYLIKRAEQKGRRGLGLRQHDAVFYQHWSVMLRSSCEREVNPHIVQHTIILVISVAIKLVF